MTDFADILADATETLRETAGVPIVYRRGEESIAIPLATMGKSSFTPVDRNGMSVKLRTVDFILPASALTFDGQITPPLVGDEIVRTINGVEYVYAIDNSGGEGCFRWSDPVGRTTLRIYTHERGASDE